MAACMRVSVLLLLQCVRCSSDSLQCRVWTPECHAAWTSTPQSTGSGEQQRLIDALLACSSGRTQQGSGACSALVVYVNM